MHCYKNRAFYEASNYIPNTQNFVFTYLVIYAIFAKKYLYIYIIYKPLTILPNLIDRTQKIHKAPGVEDLISPDVFLN